MRILAALLSSLCLAGAASAAQPEIWPESPGAGAAPVEWRASCDGFGAAVVITADPEWKHKWGAPASRPPRIPQAASLHIGEKVWALLFLTNPSADPAGAVDVTCDLRMIRPNGKITEHRDVPALRMKTIPVPRTYLSEFVLAMVGEDSDPVGEWVVEFVVHDRIRGVSVPVRGRYTLRGRQ